MKAVRISLCGLLAFTVFAHGAVEPWSEAILEIGAALLSLWWGLLFALGRITRVRWNRLLWPICGFWVLAAIQYGAGLTAVRFLTKIELLKLSALVLLFFLVWQAFETLDHWRAFAWFLLVLGFAVSVFGILQHFTFNGKLYWFRELQYGGIPFGPYVNRNHFAGFVELTIPVGLALLLLRAENRDRLSLLTVLTLVPVGALFLSASRAGITAFLLETGLIVALAITRGHGRIQVLAGAILLALSGGFVAWLGVGRALSRFETYQKLEVTESRRAEIVRDSLRIFMDHPVVGTGLGTFEAVFPGYETVDDGSIVNHMHNDYVEAVAETGAIGGVICACFLFFLFQGAWKGISESENLLDLALRIGAFSGCCALLAHSLVDFNIHIPSNAFLFLIESALATSGPPSGGRNTHSPGWTKSAKLNISHRVQTV